MMQASVIGGQLSAMDKLMRACAKEDGGKVRTYIDRVVTHEDGSLEFFLIVLPVVAWDASLGRFVQTEPANTRDTDGSPKGQGATRPDGEAATAGAEGIAQGPSA